MIAEYRLGTLTLEHGRQLRAGQKPVALSRKPLSILTTLAHASGRLVTKDEVMAEVWPGVIVGENALHVHIVALRKALGGEAWRLKTLQGQGYRLECDAAETGGGQVRLAVLAFQVSGEDQELSSLSEALSEDVLHRAGQMSGLATFGRASSFGLTGEDRKASRVATLLGATHVLDGAVTRSASGLRVSVELADTGKNTLLWSDRFDLDTGKLAAIADGITSALAANLGGSFKRQAGAVSPAAFDLCLRGRQLAGAPLTRAEGIQLLEAALQEAPDYASAWSSLALALALKARWDERDRPFDTLKAEAVAAAERALALDPGAGSAQIAMGHLQPWTHYATRETCILAASAASPNDPETLRQHAEFAYCTGRIGEALGLVERAHRMDPLNPIMVQNYANLLSEAGRTQDALAQYRFGRLRWPEIDWFVYEPVMIAAFLGDWETVDQTLGAFASRDGVLALAASTAAALRNPSPDVQEKALVRARKAMSRTGRVDISTLAFLGRLGLVDEAFDLVEQSDYSHLFAEDGIGHDMAGFIPGIIFGVTNRALRRDPRFVRLCRKLGLNAYWAETGRWPDCTIELAGVYDFRRAVLESL